MLIFSFLCLESVLYLENLTYSLLLVNDTKDTNIHLACTHFLATIEI